MSYLSPDRSKRSYPDKRSIRLVLTTDDVARLLNTSPGYVRQLIMKKQLVFTGDSITDFHMLSNLISMT